MTLEAVLLLPVVLVTIMAVVQVALFAHASGLADAAAREGVRAVRLSGEPESGRERAATFLKRHGAEIVLDPVVDAEAGTDTASVEVSGHAVTLVPGVSFPVRGHSSGPVEGFTPVGVAP